MRKVMKKNNKSDKRTLTGIVMAIVFLAVMTAGGFLYANRAYAHDTLQGIKAVVKDTMKTDSEGAYQNPFVILEIIPDFTKATYDVNGVDAEGNAVPKSVELSLDVGSVGFYVKGQEPSTKNLKQAFDLTEKKEKEEDPDVYVFSDSDSRKAIQEKLLSGGFSGALSMETDDKGTPDPGAVFLKDATPGYKELRQGEVMETKAYDGVTIGSKYKHKYYTDGQVEEASEVTAEMMDALLEDQVFVPLERDYAGENGDAYIDTARGVMTKVSPEDTERHGSYRVSYDPLLVGEGDNRKLDTDDKDAEGNVDGIVDDAYRFLMDGTGSAFTYSSAREGEFDPYFTVPETSDTPATHRAAFAYVQGASSGYKITSSVSAGSVSVKTGTPLYSVKPLDNGRFMYIFEGFAVSDDAGKVIGIDTETAASAVGLAYMETDTQTGNFGSRSLTSVRMLYEPVYEEEEEPSQPEESKKSKKKTAKEYVDPFATRVLDTETPGTGEESAAGALLDPVQTPGDDTTGGNDQTTGDGTTGGSDQTTGDGTTGGNDQTTGDDGTTGGNDQTTGDGTTDGTDQTTGDGTTGGNDQTTGDGTTGGNDQTTGDGTTGGNDQTSEDNSTGENDQATETRPTGVDAGYYYVLYFGRYIADGAGEDLYQVSYYDRSETFTEYVLNTGKEGALVNNPNGTGVVALSADTSSIRSRIVYDYDPEDGTYQWTGEIWLSDADKADRGGIYRIRGAQIYYSTGLLNRDFFKQYVFDLYPDQDPDLLKDMPIIVKTMPASQVNATEDDIANSKLLILQRGEPVYGPADGMENNAVYHRDSDPEKNKDISYDVLKKILGRVVMEGYPVVSDYGMFPDCVEWDEKEWKDSEPGYSEAKQKLTNTYYLTRILTVEALENYYYTHFIGENGKDETEVSENPFKRGTWLYRQRNLGHNFEEYINGVKQTVWRLTHVNVSVYNANYTSDANGGFLNGFFAITDFALNDDDAKKAFQPVLDDIENENIYRMANGDRTRLEKKATQATIIRYIIAYAQKLKFDQKGSLHILELAPCASYTLKLVPQGENSQKKILYKINKTDANGDPIPAVDANGVPNPDGMEELITFESGDVTLTQMTTSEFIGHVDDINAYYDMIYIGSKTQAYRMKEGGTVVEMNHTYDQEGNVTGTAYNSTSMNGLIYSNVGDTYMTSGIKSKDFIDDRSDLAKFNDEEMRFSGNDITQEKMRALREFVEAGFPVVISDELVNKPDTRVTESGKRVPYTVNHDTVDKCSYMNEMLETISESENVFCLSEVTPSLLNLYLNVGRPIINLIEGTPAEQSSKVVYTLSANESGRYMAVFDFAVQSVGISASDVTYDFHLYVDINADGKYSSTTEEIEQFTITDAGDLPAETDDLGRYMLKPDKAYHVAYTLSESFRGVMPWKIKVTQNGGSNDYRRADAIGYYEVVDPEDIPTIKVLQIGNRSDAGKEATDTLAALEGHDEVEEFEYVNSILLKESGDNHTWNMEETSRKRTDEEINAGKKDTLFYEKLHDPRVHFNVEITSIPSDWLSWKHRGYLEKKMEQKGLLMPINKDRVGVDPNAWDYGNDEYTEEEYLEFFRTNFNMLVIGFGDSYQDTDENMLKAIRTYIEEGRSVLCTHDNTSPDTKTGYRGPSWGRVLFNEILRSTFGMDRYNVMHGRPEQGEEGYDPDETFDIERAYIPKSDKQPASQTQGATYLTLHTFPKYTREDIFVNGTSKNYLKNMMSAFFGVYNKSGQPYQPRNQDKNGNVIDDNDPNAMGSFNKEMRTRYVEPVNSGQITNYPYKLPTEPFKVAPTHGQWWQLDFTRDQDRDGESDLVVWYTLGGNDMYAMSPRDVRNNYYIYNMGNVTYTGVGDREVFDGEGNYGGSSGTDIATAEVELFVNTLIAAYRSGLHDPEVKIVENYNAGSRKVKSIYLSYDDEMKDLNTSDVNGGVIDRTEEIYFVANTTSLVSTNNTKTHAMSAELYVDPENETLEIVDKKPQGTRITLEKLYRQGVNGQDVEVEPNLDGSYPIENGVVYKAVFSISQLLYYNGGKSVFDQTESDVPNDDVITRNARKVFVVATETITHSNPKIEPSKGVAKASVSAVRVQVFDMD